MENNMRNNAGGAGLVGMIVKLIVVVLAAAALYYLYRFLFGAADGGSALLIDGKQKADVDSAKPITVAATAMPGIYEGGEFTVSTWIYLQNWSYRAGFNKHILSLGGNNFDTIRLYLGANKSALRVRLHTRNAAAVTEESPAGNLARANFQPLFTALDTESELLSGTGSCDLPELDLQRWINVVVAVNGKTCDVYLDGKLTRSCVLPSFYKVDPAGYQATLLSNGGFGGYIARTQVFGSALSPDMVYKNYMNGPEPVTGILDWVTSFFEPNRVV